ncbi:tRNA lysidine(34) synthetase TilS [Mesorhizobium sp. SP-1A]|uniref:tRNA lysidine(34) synthetase TilS n=1 Tax=Mesorhizobium sp. SP-1A TaxID=3077840 RepID=UPI0028F74DDE|nr:tRNA lysidine(34) synthetase TilS [Mesorhizobium sp. SP-1A]
MLTLHTISGPAPDLFRQIDLSGGIVAGVSGGSDSTALFLLLKRYLDQAFPKAPLLAVTVDHALRRESAAEAKDVARFCADRGIAHRAMVWNGEKPARGLPAAARQARYRLLAQAAADAGIAMVATGHTADDQAETVLMRSLRDGGGYGMAGMAPATLYDHRVWILRPLLGLRRSELRDFLRAEGADWLEDPTNADESYERPRTRAALRSDDARFGEILARAGEAARIRTDLGRRAAELIRAHAGLPVQGLVRLARDFIVTPDRPAAVHALRILLATVGGVAYLPDAARTQALFARIAKAPQGAPLRATLSRTVIDARRGAIFLHRELRGLPPAQKVSSGSVWDGRRRITFGDETGGLVIGPRGMEPVAGVPAQPADVPQSLARRALAAEPVVLKAGLDRKTRTENAAGFQIRPVAAPFAHFLSWFDLAPARAVSALIGAGAVPELPWAGKGAFPPAESLTETRGYAWQRQALSLC